MASPSASAHLPALGDCLDGSKHPLSWKTTYLCIRDNIYLAHNGPVHQFLADPQSLNYLTNIDSPFPPQDPTGQAAFERVTSAINAPSSADGSYDIKQIKEDALWLSKEAGIDQVAALRLVVLELQSQPEDSILKDFQSAETEGASLSFQKSALLQSVLGKRQPEALSDAYNTTTARRGRLLGLFVSEREYAIKCRELIAYTNLSGAKPGPAWLREVGKTLTDHWFGPGEQDLPTILIKLFTTVETNLESLRGGFPWLRDDEKPDPSLTASWYEAGGNEIVHNLSLALHIIQHTEANLRAEVVSAWFILMEQTMFFSQPEAIDVNLTPLQAQAIQSLTAIVSAGILQPVLSVASVSQLAIEGSVQSPTAGSFLRDSSCVELVNAVIFKAAEHSSLPAGPALLVWSILLFSIRYMAKAALDHRDTRSEHRAIEMTHAADSDNDSVDSSSPHAARDLRRASFGSDGGQTMTLVETIWDVAQRASEDDISEVFFEQAQLLSVFSVMSEIVTDFCGPYGTAFGGLFGIEARLVFLDVLKVTNANLPYDADVVSALVAVLGGGERAEVQRAQYTRHLQVHPVKRFWDDEKCRNQFFEISRTRFPRESSPFLALCQCLAPVAAADAAHGHSPVIELLRDLPTITTMAREDYKAGIGSPSVWSLLEADNDQGNIQLISTHEIIPNALDLGPADKSRLDRRLLSRDQSSDPYVIPEGTYGYSLTDEKPVVVMWTYRYSGLAYLGLVLDIAGDLWLSEKAGRLQSAHASIVNDSLGLITRLLENCDDTEALEVIGDCSESLGNRGDIVQVVFDIYENLLYRSVVDQVIATLLVACSDLVRHFIKIMPGRVWPYMGRSGLLGIDKTDSRLRAVIASSEIPTGQFAFLLSNVRVFEALVDDAVTNCLKRKSPSKAIARFQGSNAATASMNITEAAEKRILGQFQALLVDIFESSQNWRFQKVHEKARIITILLKTMDRVLIYYDQVDDASDPSKKLVAFLAPTYQHIANSFLVNSQNNAACHALFQLLSDAVEAPLGSFTTEIASAWLEQSTAALTFASRLVRLRTSLGQSPGVLEAGLLKLVPTFVKTYVLHPQFKLPVIVLLRDLVVAANKLDSPPSILAHLSTDTAKNFLRSLRKFQKPFADPKLGAEVWKFASAVVSLRQRWFSIVLLTGSTPRDTLKSKADEGSQKPLGSFLSLAIQEAAAVDTLNSDYATNLLEFLAQAADFWPWVADKLRKDKATWDALIAFIVSLKEHRGRSGPTMDASRVQIATHILDVAAVLVHQGAGNGDVSVAKGLVEKFTYLFEHGVSSPQYSSTLHARLESNFRARYEGTGCELANFKRSARSAAPLGDDFYYDMDFASKLLSYDDAWDRGGGKGFVGDLHLANRNLSLVEAQIRLFQSWKSLCAEITSVLVDQPDLREQMLRVAQDCILENLRNTLPLNILQRLSQSRAELAFTVLQFIAPQLKRSEMTEKVLFHAWDLVREQAEDVSLGVTGDSADYYRTCLRILYLILQPHTQPQSLHASRSQFSGSVSKPLGIDVLLLEISRTVVARGFQAMVTLLHDDPERVEPADFALIQAMLHTILQSPDIERHAEALLNIFSDARTPIYAATLFSWADRILVDGDPVYGEVSINLLLELSSVIPIAEAIVTSGALGQIGSSNLARVWQKGVGQFDQPSRLYTIWVKGILPLTVNLLVAIGALIGADTASFINQFSGQLEKASASLDSATSHVNAAATGLVTLSMAAEANTLALISSSLLAFKDAGASVGILASDIPDLTWNRAQVKRDIEDRLSRRAALRDSIVATDGREELWARQKAPNATHNAENQLEHRVVELLTGALELLGSVEA